MFQIFYLNSHFTVVTSVQIKSVLEHFSYIIHQEGKLTQHYHHKLLCIYQTSDFTQHFLNYIFWTEFLYFTIALHFV